MGQIRSNLTTLMGSERYSVKCVHERTRLVKGTISGLYNLYNDCATRIDFATISKSCKFLACDVNQLFVLEKDR